MFTSVFLIIFSIIIICSIRFKKKKKVNKNTVHIYSTFQMFLLEIREKSCSAGFG
jgi:hypothetical protein